MVQGVLDELREEPIEIFVVWTAVLRGDDFDAALGATRLIPDRRARHYWDGDRSLGEAYARVLDTRASMAWDVYLVLDAEASWEGGPPAPAAWSHQLRGEDDRRVLGEERLESDLREALRRAR